MSSPSKVLATAANYWPVSLTVITWATFSLSSLRTSKTLPFLIIYLSIISIQGAIYLGTSSYNSF